MITFKIFFLFIYLSFSFSRSIDSPFFVVSGIAQDAGYPQAGCDKECCKKYRDKKTSRQKVSCLVLFDPATHQKWLFDATPDFTEQLHASEKYQQGNLSGIFLTHAHIGHYTGLMYLGKEGMNAKEIPVYVMPRMYSYLQNNGPWSQLVNLKNIQLRKLRADSAVWLTDKISITPLLVPHRDEYSETVGYSVRAQNKSLLFIPDIDKWQKWKRDIKTLVQQYDYLFLDGTFYNEKELPGRNMSEFPHPFVQESMEMFKDLPASDKRKIWFIHFNHTNPLLDSSSKEYMEVKNMGFNVALEESKIRF
jgi:pyrroloquinoline quinone biosynthesis protein B